MPYYHVAIEYVTKKTGTIKKICAHDMSEESVRNKVAEPYMNGRQFMLVGRPIDPFDVEVIRIFETENSASEMFSEEEWYSVYDSIDEVVEDIMKGNIGKHVTTKFITSPPSTKKVEEKTGPSALSKNVFIVHGRDAKPLKELKTMLTEFGLSPIVLHEEPSGSRTIVEKLEKYSDVGYAFVILTPDDVAGSTDDFTKLEIQDIIITSKGGLSDVRSVLKLLKHRARQNVILEFGYFMGLIGRDRVCCLYKGDVELPSDMHGIVYIPFKESVKECHDKIIKELKAVGYEIKV